MSLRDYLSEEEIAVEEFADLVNSVPSTVYRWLSGTRIPRPAKMAEIEAATNGAVTPASFYPQAIHTPKVDSGADGVIQKDPENL